MTKITVTVANWAHRALRGMARYHHCRDEPDYCRRFPIDDGNPLIGVYENPVPEPPPFVLFYERHMVWSSANETQRVAFADMRGVRGPGDKNSGREITIDLRDGRSVVLRIAGTNGQYRDLYEVLRFLDRVIALHEDR